MVVAYCLERVHVGLSGLCGVGGRGDIKHAFKRLYRAPLHADA